VRALFAAIGFLTVLPVPGSRQLRDEDWGRAVGWYPAVGLLVGGLLGGLDWLLRQAWPQGVASVLTLAAWVVLTGALHLDGLVDCCDALLAPVSAERRLEILRDVHAGTFGLVGAILLLLLKAVALSALPGPARPAALLLVPVLARWAMSGAVVLAPYARPGPGLGRLARSGTGARELTLATVTALLAVALAWSLGLGWAAALLPPVIALSAALLAAWIRRRIPGLTGDAYGALCEAGEIAGLLTVVALVTHGALP
jgi:adenosylcobinamide-GDP ribazoletransferase